MPQQFNNPANPDVHRRTTAVEIYESMRGKTIDAFVAGVGTGGTITGVGEFLKSKNPDVKIIAVEPESSPVLSGGGAGFHKIQGIGAGFIPKILNTEIIDDIITVSDENAYDMAKKLGKREGLMVGISSGAACFAAMKVAAKLGRGANVVTLFPDTGSRYMSVDKDFK
jgi:cysteine synthase A